MRTNSTSLDLNDPSLPGANAGPNDPTEVDLHSKGHSWRKEKYATETHLKYWCNAGAHCSSRTQRHVYLMGNRQLHCESPSCFSERSHSNHRSHQEVCFVDCGLCSLTRGTKSRAVRLSLPLKIAYECVPDWMLFALISILSWTSCLGRLNPTWLCLHRSDRSHKFYQYCVWVICLPAGRPRSSDSKGPN